MATRKVEAESGPKLIGMAEANWKIWCWTGPLAHLMRSKAECFVNVPIENSPTENIQLRFHLKPYKNHPEPQQKFCEQRNEFIRISTSCKCSTCKRISIQDTTNIPEELLPEVPTRSSGYSLLVDVLNGPENLALMVSASKLNGESWSGFKTNLVIVDNVSGYLNLPVVDNFWRMMKWTEGKGGRVENFTRTKADNVQDALFKLGVSAYKVTTTGTDAPVLKNLVEEKVAEELVHPPDVKNPIKENSDVILQTEDGMDVHAHKSILTAKSVFFLENLTENTKALAVPLDSELLVSFLHWMYKGEWPSNYYINLDEICNEAFETLEMNNEFWDWLDANLERFFDARKIDNFLRTVEKYNLTTSASLLQKIESLQNPHPVSGDNDYETRYECEHKRDFLANLKQEVNYLKVEISSKKSKHTSEASPIENEVVGASEESTTTTSVSSPSPKDDQSSSSSSKPARAQTISSESNSDLSFKVVDKQNDTLSKSESDDDDDGSMESFCEVGKQTKEGEQESGDEIKKLSKEFAKLLKRFRRLTQSE